MKQILVTIKNVYGNQLIYPACEDAKRFAEIAGSKTLTTQTLKLIQSLGYEIGRVASADEVKIANKLFTQSQVN